MCEEGVLIKGQLVCLRVFGRATNAGGRCMWQWAGVSLDCGASLAA